MSCRPFAIALLTCLLPAAFGAHGAQPQGEQLLFAKPEDWHEVFAEVEDNLSTNEYVPADQSAENWKEMVTVQVIFGMADANPDGVLSRIVRHLEDGCPGFSAQPIELGGTGDYPTLAVMLMCPKNPESGHGDFILVRGIAGKESFYILQKAWRVPPFEPDSAPPVSLDERKFWLGYLAYLTVCDPGLKNCPENIAIEE
ncbi:MAG: hypothetical protein RLW62_04735 [Gammaproteobacteria bacterium]